MNTTVGPIIVTSYFMTISVIMKFYDQHKYLEKFDNWGMGDIALINEYSP